MKFNKYPWVRHLNNEYKFTFEENLPFLKSFIRKESNQNEVKTIHGTILFEHGAAYFTGEWQEEQLELWNQKFLSWQNLNYKNIYEFLINEYREIDNEIFFREFDIDEDINLSRVNEYIPLLEKKGLVFDFRRFNTNDNIEEFVLEDCDDSILIIPLSQRKLENKAYISVNQYITKVDYIEAQKWMANILLGYIMTVEENENEINHIVDFFNSEAVDKSQIALTSYKEIIKRADKWTDDFNKKLKSTIGFEGSDYKTLYSSKNGYTLVKLISEESKKNEGKEMGNCIGHMHLTNEHLYSVRCGKTIVCSLDVRTNNKGYVTREIKGPRNQAVHAEHRADVIDCLLNYFKLDIEESRELENVGLYKVDIGLNHPKYTIPSQKVLVKSQREIKNSIYDISFCTDVEIDYLVNSVLESILPEQQKVILDVFEFLKTQAHVKNTELGVYVSKEDNVVLKDFVTLFSPEEMDLIIKNSIGKKEIKQRYFEMHNFKIFGREIKLPIEKNIFMHQECKGYFLTKEELFKQRDSIKDKILKKAVNVLNRIDELFDEFIKENAICSYSNVLIKKEEFNFINTVYSYEPENPELFKMIIHKYDDTFSIFLTRLFSYYKQELGGKEFRNSVMKSLDYYPKDILKNQENRMYAYKIATLFDCADHIIFYSFFKQISGQYTSPSFSNDDEFVLELIPTSSMLHSIKEDMNDFTFFNGDHYIEEGKDHTKNKTKLDKTPRCSCCQNSKHLSDQESIVDSIDSLVNEINELSIEYIKIYNELETEYSFITKNIGFITDSIIPVFKKAIDVQQSKINKISEEELNKLKASLIEDIKQIQLDIGVKLEDLNVDYILNLKELLNGCADDIDTRLNDISNYASDFEKIKGEDCDEECGGDSTIDENQLDIDYGNNLNIRTHEFSSFNNIIRDFFKLNINADEFTEQLLSHWNNLYTEKSNS